MSAENLENLAKESQFCYFVCYWASQLQRYAINNYICCSLPDSVTWGWFSKHTCFK